MYTIYARYQKGAIAPPHTHPDDRVVTVISGVLYSGIGPEMTEQNLKPLQPGMTVVIPANTPHFGVAKDGEVLLLESGTAPTATRLLK
jgi:quercetin dioxygenase-like cupin family protein